MGSASMWSPAVWSESREPSDGRCSGGWCRYRTALRPAGSAATAIRPAPSVPVATHIGGIDRHDDHVSEALWNLPVAARALVGLGGLVGLDETFFQLAEDLGVVHLSGRSGVTAGADVRSREADHRKMAHTRSRTATRIAAPT